METIELPVTWQGIVPILLAVLQNGDAEGRKMAREELTRMAQLADLYAAQKQQEATVQNAEGYSHCEMHDEWYDSKYWSCCEKCWANLQEGKN